MAPVPIDRDADALDPIWIAKVFAGIFLFICVMLWGVYVPVMKQFSKNAMKRGDAYWSRADQIRSDSTISFKDVEELDVRINEIFKLEERYFEWNRGSAAPYDPNDELNRTLVDKLKELAPKIRTIDDFVFDMTKDDNLGDTFAFLFDHLKSRAKNVDERLTATVGKPLVLQTHTEEYYSGLYYAALPDLLTTLKKIHDLYIPEQCYDRAMKEYIDAVAYSRLWPLPRRRLGDLYRERGWPEFAMAEYLRVIKLDPSGEDGRLAFDELKKYEGANAEADFNIALAYLLKYDNAAAETHLRRFVERAPADVLAPKASQALRYLEAGEQIYIDQYLRDEIWI